MSDSYTIQQSAEKFSLQIVFKRSHVSADQIAIIEKEFSKLMDLLHRKIDFEEGEKKTEKKRSKYYDIDIM